MNWQRWERNVFLFAVLAVLVAILAVGAALERQADLGDSAPEPIPACLTEDAEGGPLPCLWDAGTRGNSTGRSFVAVEGADGEVVYRYLPERQP